MFRATSGSQAVASVSFLTIMLVSFLGIFAAYSNTVILPIAEQNPRCGTALNNRVPQMETNIDIPTFTSNVLNRLYGGNPEVSNYICWESFFESILKNDATPKKERALNLYRSAPDEKSRETLRRVFLKSLPPSILATVNPIPIEQISSSPQSIVVDTKLPTGGNIEVKIEIHDGLRYLSSVSAK